MILTFAGLVCIGGGVVLVMWRVVEPDKAIVLPPGFEVESTPTPGYLGTPLPLPPLPTDVAVAMLPVSDPPTAQPTPKPTLTRGATLTAISTMRPSVTATATATFTETVPFTAVPTTRFPTASSTRPHPHTPTSTSTTTPTRTPTQTATLTATPSTTPSPTPTFRRTQPARIPDRILIDAIGLDAPIKAVGQHSVTIDKLVYSQWDVPNEYAVGWHNSSASLGTAGNTVLNGHHNVYGEVFRYLVALKPGERIVLEAKGTRFEYVVTQIMVLVEEGQPIEVRRENARWILPTADERVTLITCWPYTSNVYRLVVVAQPTALYKREDHVP